MSVFEIKPSDYHKRLKCMRADVMHPNSWLSKSVLWELENASLYKWRHHPKQFTPTAAMQWGTLVDCLTTTPELAETELAFSEYENYRTKAAQEWRDAALADGKIIVTFEQLTEGKKAAKMLLETCTRSAEIFAKSKSQVIVLGHIDGANVKGLIDLAPEGEDFLADLKTTASFSLDGFAKTVASFGYHVQAGLYLALWNAQHPDDQRERFKLVWQDSAEPYEVAITELARPDIEQGYEHARHLIKKVTDAAKMDHWPMAFDGVEPLLSRPTWAAMRQEEQRDAERRSA